MPSRWAGFLFFNPIPEMPLRNAAARRRHQSVLRIPNARPVLPDVQAADGFAGLSACPALKGCIRPSENSSRHLRLTRQDDEQPFIGQVALKQVSRLQ